MSRPKEFDPGEAMKEAMEAFWERGYYATSVNDLLAEMKLNRGSLYATFGDKKQLFMAALDEYERRGRAALSEALEKPGPVKTILRDWVMEVADSCSGEAGARGCLVLKAAMEVAPHDADVADWLRNVTRERERTIAQVIRRGQAEGQVSPKLEPRAVARYLMSSLAGLRVLGTASPAQRQMREVADLILRILD